MACTPFQVTWKARPLWQPCEEVYCSISACKQLGGNTSMHTWSPVLVNALLDFFAWSSVVACQVLSPLIRGNCKSFLLCTVWSLYQAQQAKAAKELRGWRFIRSLKWEVFGSQPRWGARKTWKGWWGMELLQSVCCFICLPGKVTKYWGIFFASSKDPQNIISKLNLACFIVA